MSLAADLMSVPRTLVMTLAVETAVAALFRVGRRGLIAVLLVNLVTNPVFNITVVALAWGANAVGAPPPSTGTSILILLLLEAAVVVVEWRLLLWALRSTAGDPDKLLGLAIAMNMASLIFAAMAWMAG